MFYLEIPFFAYYGYNVESYWGIYLEELNVGVCCAYRPPYL